MQLTVTNARLMALVAQEKQHWPLAGDQLYVDFDLSVDNVPPGDSSVPRRGRDPNHGTAPHRL